MMPKMSKIFGKVTSTTLKSNFGGPAGGSALERASPPSTQYTMTRRAFLSSKSNTAAVEIEFQHASQKLGQIDDKKYVCAKSVNSFHSGPIFPESLGQDLSRNVGGMSIYAF